LVLLRFTPPADFHQPAFSGGHKAYTDRVRPFNHETHWAKALRVTIELCWPRVSPASWNYLCWLALVWWGGWEASPAPSA